jgi:hypothetical protein
MRVGLLGPLEISEDGRRFGITSAKQRGLIALLALNAGNIGGHQPPAHRCLADRHAALQDPSLVLRPPHGRDYLIRRICQQYRV